MLTDTQKDTCCNAIKTLFGNSFYVNPEMITEEAHDLTSKALIELYIKLAPINKTGNYLDALYEIRYANSNRVAKAALSRVQVNCRSAIQASVSGGGLDDW